MRTVDSIDRAIFQTRFIPDRPCIISGDRILFINPLELHLGQTCATIKLINIKRCPEIDHEHLLKALDGVFGFNDAVLNTGNYDGTLFWFGLRTQPNALSENICDANQVYHLMHAFMNEAKRSLIFLKTICSVQMFASTSGSCDDHSMHTLCRGLHNPFCSVNIDNERGTLREERKSLLNEVISIGREVPPDNKFWVNRVFVKSNVLGERCESQWIVVNFLKGQNVSERFKQLLTDDDICNPHLVGVAACISGHSHPGDSSAQGHVFVYQPLPQETSSLTGLPIHINAFFVLDQNRRHIRWPEADNEDSENDKKTEWNLRLLSEILPDAYTEVVLNVVDFCKEREHDVRLIETLYHAIPDMKTVNKTWISLSLETLNLLWKRPILRTMTGQWITPEHAVYLSKSKLKEVTPTVWNHVASVYVEDVDKLVEVSDHVTESFEQIFPKQLKYLTPSLMRGILKAYDSYKSKEPKVKSSLYYFLTVDKDIKRLASLQLLPLQNSTFVAFEQSSQSVFWEDKHVVETFSNQLERFVSLQMEPSCISTLDIIRATGLYFLF